MTTIAYRDGILAADTRVCAGDMVLPEHATKVFKLDSGALVGYAGSVEQSDALHYAVINGHPTPEHKKVQGLMIQPDGSVFNYEGTRWVRAGEAPYYAIGSGSPFALAAMHCGRDARMAIHCAMHFDKDTGGDIIQVRLHDRSNRASRRKA